MNQKTITKRMRAKDLKAEDGASELAGSPAMKPYIDLFGAVVLGQDPQPFRDALARIPLEQRYVWRVLSALKWAFADFDSHTVEVDLGTLSLTDLKKLREALPPFRTFQFCMFLKALVGLEEMKKMLLQAVSQIEEPASQGTVELAP